MRILAFALGLTTLAAVTLAQAVAQQPDKHPTYKGVAAEEAAGVIFTEIEKRIIGEYFGKAAGADKGKGKSKQMPPGLARKDELPAGLQNQIVKNGTLPPGLAKRDLPSDLVLELPAAKKGTQRKIVGSDVVLIQTATGIVLDVIRDVVTSQ